MIVTCLFCSTTNDLTNLNVGYGHLLDCSGCAKQIRAMPSDNGPKGEPTESEISPKPAHNGIEDKIKPDKPKGGNSAKSSVL